MADRRIPDRRISDRRIPDRRIPDGMTPLERARELLRDVVPLDKDCGQVCGARCCLPSAESTGMLLFPGEETLSAEAGFTLTPADGGVLLTCGGRCDRDRRPLACRMFPLFPLYDEQTGRIRVVYDPRGFRLCPLVSECAHVPLRRDFVRAVRRAGRVLMQDPACAAFLRAQGEEIRNLMRFFPEERSPIMRRKIR